MRIPTLLASMTLLALVSFGCGSTVEQQPASGSGGGSSTTTTTSATTGTTGSGGACPGSPFECVPSCGGDVIGQAECVGGAWQCEPGWVKMSDCPPGSCFGLPLPCETCPPGQGWTCEPSEACAGSCDGLVCLECPAQGGVAVFGACACSCDAVGQYACELAPGCCNEDWDCGDAVYVPCVNHVCKTPVPGGCWSDAECQPSQTCEGESVCPCGVVCGAPDAPGKCVP